jgi:isocitrate dehydrogenase kinase/phosphatase
MGEPLTETALKTILEEQTDLILRTVKNGFDGVDQRFDALETYIERRFDAVEHDIVHLKERIAVVEEEVRTLGANVLTKKDLDRKFDELLLIQRKDVLFKQKLLLILAQAKLLSPETRHELEQLIPS